MTETELGAGKSNTHSLTHTNMRAQKNTTEFGALFHICSF